jgi:hypothetical protein
MDSTAPGSAPAARGVDAGRGLSWWTEAWPLFTRAAGMWIVLTIILLLLFIVVGMIPLLGGLALSLAAPVFAGGLLLAARKVDSGGALELGDLFSGFRRKPGPLLALGALLLAASIVIGAIVGLLGLGAMMGIFVGGAQQSPGTMMAAFGSGMLALLVMLALSLLLAMALWFAPALVVLRDASPVAALKASFSACLKNIVPMLLYGVLYIVAAIVASIPFGLGWIVLLPVLVLTVYTSYRDVFES